MKVLALLLPILIWTTLVNSEDVKETMGKVQEGIGATSENLGVPSETDVSTKFSRIAKVAAKVGPFLGAIGPAISIVTLFFPRFTVSRTHFNEKRIRKNRFQIRPSF